MQGSASTGLTKPDMALFCIERERETEREGIAKSVGQLLPKVMRKLKPSFSRGRRLDG